MAIVVSGLIALIAGCLAGWYGRYFVIEPEHWYALCAALPRPAGCMARDLLISFTFPARYGFVALGGALGAWMLRGRPATLLLVVALFVGGLGLFLYDTGWAASGVLAALLRLPRSGWPARQSQSGAEFTPPRDRQ